MRLTWTSRWGLRLLQVLLLCLGLVAMHQMGGGAHRMVMPAAGEPEAAASADDQLSARLPMTPGPMTLGHPTAGSATLSGGVQPSAPSSPRTTARDGAEALEVAVAASPVATPDAGAACLAVLLGLLLLLARDTRRDAAAPVGVVIGDAGHSSAPLGRGPPRRLLAQICVLRT